MGFLIREEEEDPVFIHNCEKIIQNRINHWSPKELFIISVDTFFYKESAIFASNEFSFWSTDKKFTVTNLHPNLYDVSFNIYQRMYKGYEEKTEVSYIKKRQKEEYRTYFTAYGEKQYHYEPINDGLKVYYSKNSLSIDKGSIIIYHKDEVKYNISGIYIALSKDKDWDVCETYGISSSEVQSIINENFNYKKLILRP